MPISAGEENLRSSRTGKALDIAMFSLLENRNFRRITVSDICVTALISRATFYAHFIDKYDLLRAWLAQIKPDNISMDDSYEQIEKTINAFIRENELTIKIIVDDADEETLGILFDAMLSPLNLSADKSSHRNADPKYIVLSNFYAGGMLRYLLWQIKNKFPSDVTLMNRYLYEIIEKFQEWRAEIK